MLQQVVKASAAGLDVVRRPTEGLVVLIYHRVGGSGGSVDLDPGLFDEQMAELAASGMLRSLDEGLETVAAPGSAERHLVSVTFDDGTADFVENALPILVRHQVPATLYLATKFADEGLDFPGGGRAISWGGLRDARTTGLIDVGAHTHSHVLLDRLEDRLVADELDRSNGLIEDQLGAPARHFAYPKAVLGSPTAREAVRSRYRSASVAGTRANPIGGTDPHLLQRSPVQVADGMRWFRRKASGGLRLEDDLRRRINQRRYAGATT
ncbi:N/A [soil metagenome]